MFERIYNFIRPRIPFVQKAHDWLASRIDHVLAAFIKNKISNLRSFAYKLSDKFMLYVFSVGLIMILYSMTFYLSKFVWLSYSVTDVGRLFIEKKSNAFILTQGFFTTNNLFEMACISTYCAVFLLILLSGTRLFFLNRYFYENRSFVVTSVLWGLPLTKIISLYYSGANYNLAPFVDLRFLLFLVPTIFILHPTMQFVNWLMPEAVDIYKNPAYVLRRLEIERAVYRVNNQNDDR